MEAGEGWLEEYVALEYGRMCLVIFCEVIVDRLMLEESIAFKTCQLSPYKTVTDFKERK